MFKKLIFIFLTLKGAGILPAQSCLEYLGSWGYGTTEAIEMNGKYLYASCGRYLKIYDISIPNYPKFVNEIMLEGFIEKIVVKNEEDKVYGFILVSRKGLIILDLTDLEKPIICGKGSIPWSCFGKGIEIRDDIAYVAVSEFGSHENSGVYVFDIKDVYNPKFLSKFENYAFSIALYENYAIVGWKGLQVWDISKPEEPKKVSCYEIDEFYPMDIEIRDGIAYVAAGGRGLYIFDITDPLNPKILGVCKNIFANALEIVENYAFIACYSAGFATVDIRNLENPTVISQISYGFLQDLGHRATDLVIYKKDYAFIANYDSIWFLNLKDYASYFYIETSNISDRMEVKESYIFLTQFSLGIKIIDFSNPKNPIEVSRYIAKNEYSDKYCAVHLEGNLLYFGSWLFFGILDVTDPKNPIELSCIRNKLDKEFWPIYDIKVRDDYAYTACYSEGMKIYNVSDPKNPYLVTSLPIRDCATNIELYKNFAFVSSWTGGLTLIDISNPQEPKLIWNTMEYGAVVGVEIINDVIYIYGSYGIYINDIKDPINHINLGYIDGTHWQLIGDVIIKKNILFIFNFIDGIKVAEVSNPRNPFILFEIKTPGFATRSKLFGDLLFVSNFFAGIDIYYIKNCFKHRRPF